MNISHILAEFVSSVRAEALPEEIAGNVKLRILDLLAAAAAGERLNDDMNRVMLKTLLQQGGEAQSSLLFQRQKLSAAQAAFYNAFVVSGAEMDDGHMLANGHPGVTTIPGVLALAQWRGCSWADVVAAIVAGYDVYIRLSNAVLPSHMQRGFYGTGTVGTIAAAAAAARVLGLDAEKTHVAIGLAAASASGIMEFNESAQEMKPINPANAAYKGVVCALMAENGAVAPDAPLDGKRGFFKAFADQADPSQITDGLGEVFLIDTSYIKLYPACRHLHAMVDCGVQIRDSGRFNAENVEKITLYTYPNSEKLTGAIRHPKNLVEAKFSLTYAASMALLNGNFTLKDLDNWAQIPEAAHTLIDQMEIVVDPNLEIREKQIRGARMEVLTKDGTGLTSAVDVPKGEKAFPLTDADMRKKLAACAEGVLPQERCGKIFDMALNLENVFDLETFFNLFMREG